MIPLAGCRREELLRFRPARGEHRLEAAMVLGRSRAVYDLVADEQPQAAAFGRQIGLGQRVQPARAFGSRGYPPGISERLQVTADRRLRKLEYRAQFRHG